MQLHEVPHIRLNTDFEIKCITERDLNNYFRTFKPHEESLSCDCIYSPFFGSESLYVLGDEYSGRMELLDFLKPYVPDEYVSLRLTYDFSNSPVALEYSVDEEFKFIGSILDDISQRTNLSLFLLVSHFRQFGDKKGTVIKPEHFHCLLNSENSSEDELIIKMNHFADILSQNRLFRIRIVKSKSKKKR